MKKWVISFKNTNKESNIYITILFLQLKFIIKNLQIQNDP